MIASIIYLIVYAAIIALVANLVIKTNIQYIREEWVNLAMSARLRLAMMRLRSATEFLKKSLKSRTAEPRKDEVMVADRLGQEILGL
jgi:hypothetical protein